MNPSSGVYQLLIFTRIKNQNNIQGRHANIGAENSDCVNLRDNLAILIDKCQRPAFSRLSFCNRKKSHTSPDTFRHRNAVLIFELCQNTHQTFASTKVEAFILGFLAGFFAGFCTGIRNGRSRDWLPW